MKKRSIKSKVIQIGKKKLTLEAVRCIAENRARVALDAEAKKAIKRAHLFLMKTAASGETVYGVNTGFGLLSNVKIPKEEIAQLQLNLLRSHAVGMGSPLTEMQVRSMLLLRANALARGNSGVSVQLVELLLEFLNCGVHPVIPEQGSVGASGDLAPLSHLALVLVGEGEAFFEGKRMPGAQALKAAGLKSICLGPKEGLALINGTQFMAALGVQAVLEAEHMIQLADAVGAMSLEAMRGTAAAFSPLIQKVRPHPGQIETARRIRYFLGANKPSEVAKSHENCEKVQDAYSLRCMPQVHGASRDTIEFVKGIFETEINSVTDNPLIFVSENLILSGGNFHGQYLAMALDFLAIAVSEIASISEQRLEKLINPAFSGLPAFLTPGSGINSGFMIVQVAAAAMVSENKTLAHPAVVDTIPTSADKEDHVSMGAWAARKALQIVQNSRRVLGMELMAACQGIDLIRPLKTSNALEAIHKVVRARVSFLEADRYLHTDLVAMENLIKSYELEKLVKVAK